MLDNSIIERILTRLPALHLAVVGDLFLDRYLDIDAQRQEISVETRLEAYQVTRVRSCPGAAGTIINNLVALGVGKVSVLSVIGQDGEGYELRRELERQGVDLHYLIKTSERYTPTYTKPMLHEPGGTARELNRLDIKNWTPLPASLERHLLERLPAVFEQANGMLVLDQVTEPDTGAITRAVRDRLAELGARDPAKIVLADSRKRAGEFRNVWLKPNETECRDACGVSSIAKVPLEDCLRQLAGRTSRPVFCTRGERGMVVIDPSQPGLPAVEVPAYPVQGPVDIVGAGDSTSAGIGCAYAAGASLVESAAFGNLVASITIQQIGTTGTATPEQVRERWRHLSVGGK